MWARARANKKLPSPDWTSVLGDLDRAIELFEAMGTRPALAHALGDRAMVLRALGRSDEAATADRRSNDLARELGLKDAMPA